MSRSRLLCTLVAAALAVPLQATGASAETTIQRQMYELNVHTTINCANYGFGSSVIFLDFTGQINAIFRYDSQSNFISAVLTENITGTLTNAATGAEATFSNHFVDRTFQGTNIDVGVFYTLSSGGSPTYLSVGRFVRDSSRDVVFAVGLNTPPDGNLSIICANV